jgi:hypothetical protein
MTGRDRSAGPHGFKQLLSSAVGFSNMIYRVMLTVDFLPAIKVA